MSASIEAYQIIKDYVGKRREKSDLDSLKGKHFVLKANNESYSGRVEDFKTVGGKLFVVFDANDGKLDIAFESVVSIKPMEQILLLDQLGRSD